MDKKRNTISVVIPVYNRSEMISRAVDSVLMQKEVDELLIVDDGSQDDTLSVCQQIAGKDKRVRVLQHEGGANKGSGASRNLGITSAKGELIAFLDSDDIYLENRFKHAIELFEKYDDLDVAYDPFQTGKNEGSAKIKGVRRKVEPQDMFMNIIRGTHGMFNTNTVTIKKTAFERSGLFNEHLRLHQDTELWLRLAYHAKMYSENFSIPVAHIFKHDENIMKNRGSRSRSAYYKASLEYFQNKKVSRRAYFFMLRKYLRKEIELSGYLDTLKQLPRDKKYFAKLFSG